jgi:cytochrome c-type biogenesis protein CcmF
VIVFGQLCLLAAFVATGYAAFASFSGWRNDRPWLGRVGAGAGALGALAVTLAVVVLLVALLGNDFRFSYVAQYSSRSLAWHYSLSAFWVGQAGSLLLWTWLVGVLAIIFRFWPRRAPSALSQPAFAILMAYQCFLAAMMLFGADPMQPSLAVPQDGAGLSPSLQHWAMLLHPPVVFLGYAACAIPFALAAAALLGNRLDATWVREARPWTFFAWAVLGIGILVGGDWAYEELGWGGYWNWDPVENGSLIPWLAITALIHAAMVYRQRGALKRTALVLAGATFAACNFAAFLTRSGIFSSLHAFSQSPIGWMFMLLIAVLAAAGTVLMVRRRAATVAENPIAGLLAKEGVLTASVFVFILLAAAVFLGTASLPLSQVLFPHKVIVGAGFYNGVLIPTGLVLLAAMAVAPLLRWGVPPDRRQTKAILAAVVVGTHAAGFAWLGGLRWPLGIAVLGLAAATVAGVAASWLLDSSGQVLLRVLRDRRRTYAGYAMHLAIACLAVGVAGSSLGTQRHEATLSKGESIRWAGRDVRFVRLVQRQTPEKLVVQAELQVTAGSARPYTLLPAQEYYSLQNQWNTEVAIHSNWSDDLYTILHGGEGQERIHVTLVVNPLMRWMWLAGWIVAAAAVPWFWPHKRRDAKAAARPAATRRETKTTRRAAA